MLMLYSIKVLTQGVRDGNAGTYVQMIRSPEFKDGKIKTPGFVVGIDIIDAHPGSIGRIGIAIQSGVMLERIMQISIKHSNFPHRGSSIKVSSQYDRED